MFRVIVSPLFTFCILTIVACKKGDDIIDIRNRQSKLKLKPVIDYVNSHKNAFPKEYSRSAQFSSFDFSKLIPSNNASIGNQTDVSYNKNDEIVKIVIKLGGRNDKLEFNVVKNIVDNYTILYVSYLNSSGVVEHVGGFIFNYQQHSYFITYNDNPFCVMRLDSNLRAVSTLRTLKFYSDSLYFKTRVNYRDGHLLDSETFYASQRPLANNTNTLIDDIVGQLTSNLAYNHEMELKLGIAEPDKYLPLWLWNGHQQYDIEVTPITKSIETHE